MRSMLLTVLMAAVCVTVSAQADPDPWPKTVEEFRSAVQNVLSDTGIPGAGLALVRMSGIEWAGGVGFADRDAKTPVTADTHFRAGSISKPFIASAIVQMYLDDEIDLDAPVAELASEIRIDNAWEPAHPVRVIHLLQHTAGFDDLRFNELFNVSDPPDLPLEDVLKINPSTRIVRWQPGTRMSYSNHGYTVAAYLIEKITGQKYEERIAERIFKPVGMPTSSFVLTKDDEAILAKGYDDRTGPPVPFSQIYLRPSGNLHTSALELGRWVHLMLNWGETENDLVIDPEYLSNMEHPRTTAAWFAGLRNGYGSGITSFFIEGFPMLGHSGGIAGFSSLYGYSSARDVGFVVLLNGRYSGEARERIAKLAVRYLKADVEPPPKPEADVPDNVLRSYEGYYHSANPRSQWSAFVTWLLDGQSIAVEGKRLVSTPVFGDKTTLIPTSANLFRFEADPEPSRVFTTDASGTMVLTGGTVYAERKSRLRVDSVRWTVLVSAALVATPLLMLLPWMVHARRAEPSGFWWLKFWLLCCSLGLLLPALGYFSASGLELGTRNVKTIAVFAGSVLLPVAAILSFVVVIDAWRNDAGKWLRSYALLVSIAALIVSGYLSAWGMLAVRPWSF
ncbi:MAG TPA: serine hydrolase domain-containing protein [Vicinamibacterales bacterium]